MTVSRAELKAAMDQMMNMVDRVYDPNIEALRGGVSCNEVINQIGLIRRQIQTVNVLAQLDEQGMKRSSLVLRRITMTKNDDEYKVEEVHNSLEYHPGDTMSEYVLELMVSDPMWNIIIRG